MDPSEQVAVEKVKGLLADIADVEFGAAFAWEGVEMLGLKIVQVARERQQVRA